MTIQHDIPYDNRCSYKGIGIAGSIEKDHSQKQIPEAVNERADSRLLERSVTCMKKIWNKLSISSYSPKAAHFVAAALLTGAILMIVGSAICSLGILPIVLLAVGSVVLVSGLIGAAVLDYQNGLKS